MRSLENAPAVLATTLLTGCVIYATPPGKCLVECPDTPGTTAPANEPKPEVNQPATDNLMEVHCYPEGKGPNQSELSAIITGQGEISARVDCFTNSRKRGKEVVEVACGYEGTAEDITKFNRKELQSARVTCTPEQPQAYLQPIAPTSPLTASIAQTLKSQRGQIQRVTLLAYGDVDSSATIQATSGKDTKRTVECLIIGNGEDIAGQLPVPRKHSFTSNNPQSPITAYSTGNNTTQFECGNYESLLPRP